MFLRQSAVARIAFWKDACTSIALLSPQLPVTGGAGLKEGSAAGSAGEEKGAEKSPFASAGGSYSTGKKGTNLFPTVVCAT